MTNPSLNDILERAMAKLEPEYKVGLIETCLLNSLPIKPSNTARFTLLIQKLEGIQT